MCQWLYKHEGHIILTNRNLHSNPAFISTYTHPLKLYTSPPPRPDVCSTVTRVQLQMMLLCITKCCSRRCSNPRDTSLNSLRCSPNTSIFFIQYLLNQTGQLNNNHLTVTMVKEYVQAEGKGGGKTVTNQQRTKLVEENFVLVSIHTPCIKHANIQSF